MSSRAGPGILISMDPGRVVKKNCPNHAPQTQGKACLRLRLNLSLCSGEMHTSLLDLQLDCTSQRTSFSLSPRH